MFSGVFGVALQLLSRRCGTPAILPAKNINGRERTVADVVEQHPEAFGIGRLFYATSEAIVAADIESEEIVLWNPASEALFGYTVAEALGMKLETLVPEELRTSHFAGLRRYRGGADAVLVGAGAVEVPAVTKSGRALDIALSLTDVSATGTNRLVLAVIRDVTAQRRAEREQAATNQAMREFVATASHDLRTPLASVLGFAKFLADNNDKIDDAKRLEVVQAIAHGAHHASRLVDDLLTLSQIQAEALAIRLEDVSIAAVAREAVIRASSSASIEVDEDLVARADSDHVERILVNFLTNAQRHGSEPVKVVAARQGETIVVSVYDAGPGVPEHFLERLFTSFARADPSASEGTGLGLSIVKGLAAANGGEAFYEPASPAGAGFGVRLVAAAR